MPDIHGNHNTPPVAPNLLPVSVKSLSGQELPAGARRTRAYRLSYSLQQNLIIVPLRLYYEHIRPTDTILTTICETDGENGVPIVRHPVRTAIYNVAPAEGNFGLWLEVLSGQPVWLRIDALVIP